MSDSDNLKTMEKVRELLKKHGTAIPFAETAEWNAQLWLHFPAIAALCEWQQATIERQKEALELYKKDVYEEFCEENCQCRLCNKIREALTHIPFPTNDE